MSELLVLAQSSARRNLGAAARAAVLSLLALAALALAAAENAAAQTVTTCAAPDLAGRDQIWTGLHVWAKLLAG